MKNKLFCKRLNAMIKDEKSAPKDYSKLISSANKKSVKKTISTIPPQERGHYRKLIKIKKQEC